MGVAVHTKFRNKTDNRAHGHSIATDAKTAKGDFLRKQAYLGSLYQQSAGTLKGRKMAFAAAPNGSIGTVHDWNCKAVWIDIKLEVPYDSKPVGDIHRFHNPLEIMLHQSAS